jgi:hypothetical protein
MRLLAHLPNNEGFRFTGIRNDDVEVACVVMRVSPVGTGADCGHYYAAFAGNGERCFSQLKGWKWDHEYEREVSCS